MRILLSVACIYFIAMVVYPETHDTILAFTHEFTTNIIALAEIIFKEKRMIIDYTPTFATPGQQTWAD